MKKFLLVLVALFAIVGLAGCGEEKKTEKKSEAKQEVKEKEVPQVVVNAEVNGKYFTEPTRHGVVFKDGSNGEKAILRSLDDQKKFYDDLVALGATPGNNVKLTDMTADMDHGIAVDGEKLDVYIKWEGQKEIPFTDIIKASKGGNTDLDIRFGGNLEAAKEKQTGCILCLDSCAVGITSNANYKTGSTQNNVVQFFGNDTVLPADGTKVQVIFRLHEDK
ncbi:MAG: hypothetical protein K0R71_1337 [Bacillales bacterium]|jgi:hypothetical protein|nr:hypothetical protein [Bacillales bacterium]